MEKVERQGKQKRRGHRKLFKLLLSFLRILVQWVLSVNDHNMFPATVHSMERIWRNPPLSLRPRWNPNQSQLLSSSPLLLLIKLSNPQVSSRPRRHLLSNHPQRRQNDQQQVRSPPSSAVLLPDHRLLLPSPTLLRLRPYRLKGLGNSRRGYRCWEIS